MLKETRLNYSYVNAVTGFNTSSPSPMANSTIRSGNVTQTSNTSDDIDTSSDTQNLSIDNNFHPLYLHNNDQPRMILISKKLLGSENYSSWKRSIQIALSAKNKLVIVTGEFLSPSEKSTLYAHWRRVNDMVITWILNTVFDEISNSMNYMDSASDVWNELSERFSVVSGHKIYEVQKDLFKLEQGNDSVEIYFHKLKGFWDELKALEPIIRCTCGASKEWEAQIEKTRLIQFLMGLHSSYTAARGHLLMMNPWPSLNQAYMLLKQEEKQRQIHHNTGTPLAMMVNLSKNPASRSHRQTDRPALECTYCHSKNHTKERCYKLVGYPADHDFHPNNRGKKRPFSKNFGHSVSTPQAMQVTSVDNSNTQHSSSITNQMELLQNQMNTLLKLANQEKLANSGPSMKHVEAVSKTSSPFQFGTNFAGPTPDQGLDPW
ncbi:uncharacterized protein LOC141684864 [Apium graveolens]|uniref:uncharacterized protein LOC141684864 n=1 Tax=Apium graveolens TaxID=4045 RepID=UPI003D7A85D3